MKIKNPFRWFTTKSLKQKIIITIIIVALAFFGYKQLNSSSSEQTYQFATIETGDITKIVSETGEITATNKTDVPSTINGVVNEVYVANGDQVTKGQQLFYVESTATEAVRASAWASYQSALAALEQAKASQYSSQAKLFTAWDSFKELAESDEYENVDGSPRDDQRQLPEYQTPEKEWLAAEAEYQSQDELIAKAESSLQSAWLNYQATSDGVVTATANGTIHNLSIAQGLQVTTSDSALIIKSPSETWVKVAINESDINAVQPDQKAEITIDAISDKPVSATVKRVDDFGTELSDLLVFYVYLTLDEAPQQVKPGMTTQVDIITEQKQDITLVPNSAIKLYQGNKAVQILDSETNTVIYQPITVGIIGDTNSEVISGLSQGQKIITSGASTSSNNGQSGGSSGGFLMRR